MSGIRRPEALRWIGRTRNATLVGALTFALTPATGAAIAVGAFDGGEDRVPAGPPANAAFSPGRPPPPVGLEDIDIPGFVPSPDGKPTTRPGSGPTAQPTPEPTSAQERASRSRPQPEQAVYVPPDTTSTGIPVTMLRAYRKARTTIDAAYPGCYLSTPVLSAIGQVESGHARGGYLDENGRTVQPIIGPRLDGRPGLKEIFDSDSGRLDGDPEWDHAVGPMQFIPTTWRDYPADGNGDGIGDPHNAYDATLAAAWYLCAGGGDLRDGQALRAAILRYNDSEVYYKTVIAWAQAYSERTVPVAVSPDEADRARPQGKRAGSAPARTAAPKAERARPARDATKPAKDPGDALADGAAKLLGEPDGRDAPRSQGPGSKGSGSKGSGSKGSGSKGSGSKGSDSKGSDSKGSDSKSTGDTAPAADSDRPRRDAPAPAPEQPEAGSQDGGSQDGGSQAGGDGATPRRGGRTGDQAPRPDSGGDADPLGDALDGLNGPDPSGPRS